MKYLMAGFASISALLTFSACSTSTSDRNGPVIPQRVYAPESVVIETGNFSEATSLQGERIVLLLDYIPTEPGKAAIAMGCLEPLAADFEVGYAICDNESRTKIPVFARHVDQRCEVMGEEEVYLATDTLISGDCTAMKVRSYLFDPPLRLMVQSAP